MANKKISELPTATTIGVGDLFPVVQGGVTKQATPDLLPLGAAQAAAVAATYAPIGAPARPRGPRLAAIGDSLIALGDGTSTQTFQSTIQEWLAFLSGGRFELVRNAGVSGNTSDQMLARFDTDVTPWAPDVVLVRGSLPNDSFAGYTLAHFQANQKALAAKCYAIGAVPIFDTATPIDNPSGDQAADSVTWNAWLLQWCAENGIRCGNSFQAVVADNSLSWFDPTNYTIDGLHPTWQGAKLIAKAILDACRDLPTRTNRLPTQAGQILKSAGFADGNTNGLATNWDHDGDDSTAEVYSIVPSRDGIGLAQRAEIPAATTGATNYKASVKQEVNPTGLFATGDRIRFSVDVWAQQTAGPAGSNLFAKLYAYAWNGGAWDGYSLINVQQSDGIVSGTLTFEFVMPTGAYDSSFTMYLGNGGTSPATTDAWGGWIEWAHPRFTNVTQRGLIQPTSRV